MKNIARHYMDSNLIIADENDTTQAIINILLATSHDCTEYIYVVDEQKKLKGCVETIMLFKIPMSDKISKHIKKDWPVVLPDTKPDEIANKAITYSLAYLPVTDEKHHLLGAIPAHAIMEILRKEHIEDMHRLAGINKGMIQVRHSIEAPPLVRAKDRLPWLLIGLVGSMLATFLMTRFDTIIEKNIALSFFVPGIVYLADAIGTQSETIAVRGISLSNISLKKILIGEFGVGFLIGLILSIIYLPFALLMFNDIRLAITVSSSILCAGTIASIVGMMFPWILHYFKIDPAFGSGPMATIIQDILSILVYFFVAQLILFG